MKVSRTAIIFILACFIICFTSISYAESPGKIAFTRAMGFRTEIVIADADGKNMEVLTEGVNPSWSPDGTEIAFVDGIRIFIMDPDGENVRRLTDSVNMGEYESAPSWFGIPAPIQPQNSLMATWGEIKTNSE